MALGLTKKRDGKSLRPRDYYWYLKRAKARAARRGANKECSRRTTDFEVENCDGPDKTLAVVGTRGVDVRLVLLVLSLRPGGFLRA